MRLPPVETNPDLPPLPMLEPELKAVEICPRCRKKLRRTSELCPHCGAERQYGPTRTESIVCTALGTLAVPALLSTLVAPSGWTVAFAGVGALLGFFVAQVRFSGDRWVPPKSAVR